MDSPILMMLSIFQRILLVVRGDFSCFFNDSRLASWSACRTVLMPTTTFKCSLRAFLVSMTLFSPPTVMALTQVHCLAGWCFLGALLLKAPHEEHTLLILEHVDWVIPNNFDTSHVLRPCGKMAIALNLFSFGNALMCKEDLQNCKRKCPKRPHYYPKLRGSTLGGVVNLLLQSKVSDDNNSKIELIDLSSFKTNFLCCCYNTQARIWKDDSQLDCAFDLIYGLA
jgi:hypothetical protein